MDLDLTLCRREQKYSLCPRLFLGMHTKQIVAQLNFPLTFPSFYGVVTTRSLTTPLRADASLERVAFFVCQDRKSAGRGV